MKEILEYQYKNRFLWAPFLMAFGAALYFGLDFEPVFHFPILITLLCGAIIYKNKNIFVRIFALFLFGFFYAMSFTHIIDTPKIKDSFGYTDVIGTIKNIDFTSDSTRVILSVPPKQFTFDETKENINLRITLKNNNDAINIGNKISGPIKAFNVPAKHVPSSFDYARWMYFSDISGNGFFKEYKIIKSDENKNNLRTYIHNQANSKLTDALVLGYKQVLPKSESEIWKSVGVAHVWSISGFHMTLVGGWLFVLFYLLFRSIPYITKRIPAKYPSLICAWFGLMLYLCVSGISVATIRAFLMATLIFAATLFGRSVFSLRNAALVFLVIFMINPFFVMNAGFQLSFAAVFGLLWFYEGKEYLKRDALHKTLNTLYITFMTAFIASIFTLPFIIAHFGYIPIYTLLGNVIILPIFSFAIMPLIVIGTICAMFGNYFVIDITNVIYNWALTTAKHIADLPYANLQMPQISNTALLLSIFGLMCLVLIAKPDSKNFIKRNINYILCLIFMLTAITMTTSKTKPLFYSTTDNELVGFVVNGKLKFNKSKSSKHFFAFNAWREINNEKPTTKNERYKCEHGFCVYKTEKWKLVYMQTFTAVMNHIEKTCRDNSVDFIVSPFKIRAPKCHAKILHHGLLIDKDGKIIKFANQRPWHSRH